jgi:hypothetical protein
MLPDVAKQLRQCFIDIYKSKHNGPMGAQIYIEPDLSIKKPHTIYLINKKVVLDALSANTPHFMINN